VTHHIASSPLNWYLFGGKIFHSCHDYKMMLNNRSIWDSVENGNEEHKVLAGWPTCGRKGISLISSACFSIVAAINDQQRAEYKRDQASRQSINHFLAMQSWYLLVMNAKTSAIQSPGICLTSTWPILLRNNRIYWISVECIWKMFLWRELVSVISYDS
jgi:hypothetical protein